MPKLKWRNSRGRGWCGIYLVFPSEYEAEQFYDKWWLLTYKFRLVVWDGCTFNAIAIWDRWGKV